MALALFDRVQETTTTTGTGSVTLAGALPGFQSFAVVGNGNTCYYTIVDVSAWEVGIGTYSTSGPTLARTTILSNSNGNTSPITLAAGVKSIFLTYPAEKSVNLDASDNVSPLGTVSSGVWQGSTVGVAYGGTGVTASSGANSVVLRDSNQNITVNRVNQSNTNTTAAGGTTALTAASSYIHTLVGTGGQTYTLPDATTLTTGVAFVFNNLATGTLTLANYAGTTVGTVPSGGAAAVFLTLNSTTGGTWDLHAYLPEGVTFGTNAFNLGTSIISGGTWQGGTIQTGYGGTGLTSYTSGGAVYANSSSTLTSGTLPVTAGGTGNTSGQAASTASSATFNSGGAGGASGSTFNGSGALTVSYNTIGAPSTTGTNASGTWGISISGNAATATSATSATNATNATNLTGGTLSSSGGTVTGGIGISGSYTTYSGQALTIGSDASYAYIQSWGSRTLWLNPQGNSIIAGTGASPVLTSANYNSYAPTLTGTGASGTWGIRVTGFANAGTPRLYASDSPYNYDGAAPYYMAMTYDGSRWLLQVTPGTPAAVRVAYADVAGSVSGYLPLSGGTMTGSLSFAQSANINFGSSTTEAGPWTISVIGSGGATPATKGTGYGRNLIVKAGNSDNGGGLAGGDLYLRAGAPTAPATSYGVVYLSDDGGFTQAGGSLRAPIFYDSGNTAYYVDPAPGSNGVSANFQGRIQVGTFNNSQTNSGEAWLGRASDRNSGTFTVQLGGGSSSSRSFEVVDYAWSVVLGSINSDGNSFAYSSYRAPIFYDRDNTGYYVDPASTSNLNGINVPAGSPGFVNAARGSYYGYSSGYGTIIYGVTSGSVTPCFNVDPIGNASGSFNGNGGEVMFRNGVQFISPNSANNSYNNYFILQDGYVQANNSSRAPIFYDSNNTGYYLVPASGSNLNGTLINNGGTAMTAGWNRNLLLSSTFPVIVFNSASSKYSGIGVDYSVADSGFVFWVNGSSADVTGTGAIALRINTGNFVTAAGSFRAPIFYDSNDTAYYVDPNSTSRIRKTNLIASGSGWDDGLNLYSSDASNRWNLLVDSGASNWLRFAYNQSEKFQIQPGGAVISFGDIRSTIFYDQNNTGYYLDPTSTTSIRTVGSWRADSASWDGEFSGKIQYHSSNWYFQYAGSMLFRNSGGSNVFTVDQSGNAVASGNVTAYSDARLKENVVTIDSALDKVLNLRGVYYNKIGNPERRVGVIAQEIETVLPEVVRLISDTNPSTEETQELLAVDYGNIAGLLIEAAKEQNQEVVDLRNRVAQLESLIHKLIGD